jgi:hypothetical protein
LLNVSKRVQSGLTEYSVLWCILTTHIHQKISYTPKKEGFDAEKNSSLVGRKDSEGKAAFQELLVIRWKRLVCFDNSDRRKALAV